MKEVMDDPIAEKKFEDFLDEQENGTYPEFVLTESFLHNTTAVKMLNGWIDSIVEEEDGELETVFGTFKVERRVDQDTTDNETKTQTKMDD